MLLEVECYTLPHLKALTHGIEHASGHGRGSTFTMQKTSLKSPHLYTYPFRDKLVQFGQV